MAPPAGPECPRGPIARFGYTLDEFALPDATSVKAIAVRAGRAWILTRDTLMEHDGIQVFRETALCGGELKESSVAGRMPALDPAPIAAYSYLAADEKGALAVGTNGARVLVSRVSPDGQLHCRESSGIYPASPIAEDGVWLVRTRTGMELQDESGWRSAAVQLAPDAMVHGVAQRGYALVHALRLKAPWTVYRFEGRAWHPTQLPVMFSYMWVSEHGLVLANSMPAVSDMVGRPAGPTGRSCEVLARIERGGTIQYVGLPTEFRPNAIVGRMETDLWLTGLTGPWSTYHWDGKIWREAAPPIQTQGGVVDEDGAFWFVGARSSTGWPNAALYRLRRK